MEQSPGYRDLRRIRPELDVPGSDGECRMPAWLMDYVGTPPPGRVCDIGCGNGSVLRAFRAMGSEVVGVECDEEAARLCESRGIDIIRGPVQDILGALHSKGPFDLILMSHVIEHLPRADVPGVLAGLSGCLQPGWEPDRFDSERAGTHSGLLAGGGSHP